MSGKKLIVVGLLFNVYWLIAVLGQQAYVWVLVLLFAACWWKFPSVWRYAFSIAVAGVLMDGVLSISNVLDFQVLLIPNWLIMLWLGFGTFVWFIKETIANYSAALISLLGGVGGAMSYFAGYRLQAVQWPLGVELTLMVLFLSWFVLSTAIVLMIKRKLLCEVS
ncbi:DUF2878 domain-containing protein [Photobacterium sp. DNB23_23_1]